MGRKSSKKYIKEVNAQIVLFVLIMIIMRMVVLNFMSDLSGIGFEELSKARIYNGNISTVVFLEGLVNFFGSFILETYKGITLIVIINIVIASYILSKKDLTGNFYFNMLIAYVFSSIITVFLLLGGVLLFFAIIQGMVLINSFKIDVSSEILWITFSVLLGILIIKHLRKNVVFSLIVFITISIYSGCYMEIGKDPIKTDDLKYSLEEFSYNLSNLDIKASK
ncbi:hypothetical protein [Clostridium sp.]|uniref:hypothetical protein n=1 Tax=Clostridium sp. TaxID=1506 RepID=UPI00262FA699|nr:hypothetical protein [Clostridium sp.]